MRSQITVGQLISRCCLLWFGGCWALPARVDGAETMVLVSSFAEQGFISGLTLNSDTGELHSINRSQEIPHPFYFDVTADRNYLYTIHAETFGGEQPEQLAAFRLDRRTGDLQPLNRQSTRGTASCYVQVDATDGCVLVANYLSGEVLSYRINADGSLTEAVSFVRHSGSSIHPNRQRGPHAHCFVVSPDNRHAYAADLGLDQIVCYEFNALNGQIRPNYQPFVRTPAGAGPRHLVFHPGGRKMYVINELQNSVTYFEFLLETGIPIERQTISTLPEDFKQESYCADVRLTPDGQFLYGTNRGHDSIAIFRIATDGQLTAVGIEPSLGKGPQNLAITADGRWLLCANMPGNSLVVFRIDSDTGQLTAASSMELTAPSCIQLLD